MSSTWADEMDQEEQVPTVTLNPDGTKTIVTYGKNAETGRKERITQKVREVKVTERVNHAVAERRKWAKYGTEKGKSHGVDKKHTQVGESMIVKLSARSSKALDSEADKEAETIEQTKEAAAAVDSQITCRLCKGPHFTAKCPYKNQLGEDTAAMGAPTDDVSLPSSGPSGYVPPHMRNRGGAAGADPGRTPYQERDDSTTLRVSNLSEDITEDELRYRFSKFGRIARCFLLKDRETGRNRGFAFISFDNVMSAQTACDIMDGKGFDNLIMRVEFSKSK